MNGLDLSRYVGRVLNHGNDRGVSADEWEKVVIDNRSCLGCFGSEVEGSTATIGAIGATDIERLRCWIDLPVDDCGQCVCRIYCGSLVQFPESRPGEVYEAVARVDTTRNRCQRWSLKLHCGPCD